MGLDMCLEADRYVGGWKHSDEEEKKLYKQLLQAVGTEKLASPKSPSVHVRTTVAYWRKANAIHSWFVRELADGVDECQAIHVPVEVIKRLIHECWEALKLYNAGELEKAEEHMPPKAGCFFGSCEIDEWWAEGLKSTIEQLSPLVAPEISEKFDFYYRASW